ncbi:MAG TPA: hypothetical protein VFW69_05020 [Mycobacterium sp.]|nr:hypothetical protein [Mycobacterium sp.]
MSDNVFRVAAALHFNLTGMQEGVGSPMADGHGLVTMTSPRRRSTTR